MGSDEKKTGLEDIALIPVTFYSLLDHPQAFFRTFGYCPPENIFFKELAPPNPDGVRMWTLLREWKRLGTISAEEYTSRRAHLKELDKQLADGTISYEVYRRQLERLY